VSQGACRTLVALALSVPRALQNPRTPVPKPRTSPSPTTRATATIAFQITEAILSPPLRRPQF